MPNGQLRGQIRLRRIRGRRAVGWRTRQAVAKVRGYRGTPYYFGTARAGGYVGRREGGFAATAIRNVLSYYKRLKGTEKRVTGR